MTRKPLGFTLIELMITIAVIGIMASIAYPSYQEYLRRGHRADAKAALLENAQFLERNFTEVNRYHQDGLGNAVVLPVTASPREAGSTVQYALSLDAAGTSATTFRLLASPAAGGVMATDPCGTFTLNQLGQKGVANATRSAAECWQK